MKVILVSQRQCIGGVGWTETTIRTPEIPAHIQAYDFGESLRENPTTRNQLEQELGGLYAENRRLKSELALARAV